MPIVNLDIVPELMNDDGASQYQQIALGINDAITSSTGAPAESVHVLINEVSSEKYAVGDTMLSEQFGHAGQAVR